MKGDYILSEVLKDKENLEEELEIIISDDEDEAEGQLRLFDISDIL